MIEVPKRAFDAMVMFRSLCLARQVGAWVGRPQGMLDFEVELTRLLGLFDRDHYLSQIDPASLGQQSALRHYVAHGDAAGLSPSPLFDVRHYDAHCGPRRGVNRLLHFGLVAHFKGLSPSPWFDPEYYLRHNPDVGETTLQALAHFQRWGWREGRNPLPGLDMRRLLNARPELKLVKGSALAIFATEWMHQYAQGRLEGPAARAAEQARASQGPDMRDPAVWADVQPRAWAGPLAADILIPVYGGLQETLRCLHSVLTAPVRTPHRVVVINDAGPDPELNALLRSLAARDLFLLEQHRSNQGFVKTVNHGLRLCRERDVVILNSDTEVYNDWLDRLLAHARAHPRLASITPLSNNATICSYPQTLSDNRLQLELGPDEIDRLAAEANRGAHVAVPTGVGFCMFMRREALDEVGPLDERHFGRGYGEENDWCQRAQRKGWRNVIACDVYVRHVGSVSFKAEAEERTRAAMKALAKLHPNYHGDVERYIAQDPTWPWRARLDLARLRRQCGTRNVLLVSHNRGGGTERHLLEQTRELMDAGCGVFELRPSSQAGALAVLHPGLLGLSNLGQVPMQRAEMLGEVLDALKISEIHLHHLIDFPPGMAERLSGLAASRGIAIRVAVHDYFLLCPRVNLVNVQGHYCGQPSAAECERCLDGDGLKSLVGTIERWRGASRRLLTSAREVVVPHEDVAERLAAWGVQAAVRVVPHEEDDALPRTVRMDWQPEAQPLRVLVIGAIGPIKGFDVLCALAAQVQQDGLPMHLALLGYSSDDARLASLGVQLLGRYFDSELADKIAAHDPHLILVPSIWPETYCYVLSGALASGRAVAVFDLGAQAARTRAAGAGHLVLPLALSTAPLALAQALLDGARGLARAATGAPPP